MKRVLLCCALLGALVLAAVACKSIASGAASSTAAKGEQAKPSPTDTDTAPPEPIKGSYETIPQDRAKSEMDALSAEGKPFVSVASEDALPVTDAEKASAEQAEKENIHVSIGTYVVREGEDIRTAMRVADERMYADKNAYYEAHPELKYR